MTGPMMNFCPTCGSYDPRIDPAGCYNVWHKGQIVHLQNEPLGMPHAQCNAVCGAEVDDAPSQLSVAREFVTCRECYRARKKLGEEGRHQWRDPAVVIRRHQELTDDEIDRATSEELRAAYRSLRDHHVQETTALIAHCDALLSEHAPPGGSAPR